MAKQDLPQQRLLSLDAYRGFIMIVLAFTGFGLAPTAELHLQKDRSSTFWHAVAYQFDHVQWVGCSFWDLIQPSFMFMVGAAMAFSYLRREREGQSYLWMFGHAVSRSLILIFLGIFLISNNQRSTVWSFVNVLTQIGLGYPILFLLWKRPLWLQGAAAAVLLIGAWLLYATFPNAGINLDTGKPAVGVTSQWAKTNLEDVGVPAAWHKNANVGHAIDVDLLNHLPQRERTRALRGAPTAIVGLFATPLGSGPLLAAPLFQKRVYNSSVAIPRPAFEFNSGGYQTINFLPSLATMIFGLMAGELLRSSSWSDKQKWLILVAAGAAGLIAGQVMNQTNLCPLVKRIWTPSWTLFSTGWCLLMLAAFYGVIDVLGWRWWTFPLMVVGVNSLLIYCLSQLLPSWTAATYRTHLGSSVFRVFGLEWEPTVQATMVGAAFWLVCLVCYWKKLFLRI